MSFLKTALIEVAGGVGSALGTVAGVLVGGVTGIVAGAYLGYCIGEKAARDSAEEHLTKSEAPTAPVQEPTVEAPTASIPEVPIEVLAASIPFKRSRKVTKPKVDFGLAA